MRLTSRRAALAYALAAGVLLAGCGSAASTPAPVESSPSGGEVAASVPDCPEGAPARDGFQSRTSEFNGVVGTLYNDTGEELQVTAVRSGTVCRLAAGRSVVFADGRLEREIQDPNDQKRASYIVKSPSGAEAEVQLTDPNYGRPWGDVFVPRKYASCTSEGTGWLAEGETWEKDTAQLGHVRITRLDDDADAARRWSGTDSWTVDDWQRIDVRFLRLSKGC